MAQAGVSANRLELLQIADAVAREKAIDRQVVIMAMEDAIQKAAKSRYGSENEIKAEVDPKTGEIRLARLLEVVEQVTMEATQISLEEARRRNPAAQVGDFIAEPLPPLDFGRVAAQNAKQVIVQKVREAERERQFDEYKDRVGEIVNGIVKRVEYGNVIVDLGRAEAIVRRDETLPRENFRYGDRIRAYVYDVRREQRGPQIFLSRTHPEFMAKLFAQEVPEVYDGIVTIKSVARDPGSRAKIAVVSRDASIDPVGACVGMRGSRVQAVVNELQGEKIDIIQWSPDAATFIVNALAPAEVVKVVLDEDAERIEVVVPDAQLSLAIGRKGQNVRLASQLTGWDIDIMTEAFGVGAPPGRVCRALRRSSWRRSTSTRSSPSCLRQRASPRSRKLPSSSRRRLPPSKASMRAPRRRFKPARASIWRRSRPNRMPSARRSACPMTLPRSRASPRRCWWRSARRT